MSKEGVRVSVPHNTRKTISLLKEIARNHTEDEIYATLKDCSMDPNETAQKLLFQDTFHEVRRKREKKKESTSSSDSGDSRSRPGVLLRGSRDGRVNLPPRYTPRDIGGRSFSIGRNAIVNENKAESARSMAPLSKVENKEMTSVSGYTSRTEANGSTFVDSKTFNTKLVLVSSINNINPSEPKFTNAHTRLREGISPQYSTRISLSAIEAKGASESPMTSSSMPTFDFKSSPPRSYESAQPSFDDWNISGVAVSQCNHEISSQPTAEESNLDTSRQSATFDFNNSGIKAVDPPHGTGGSCTSELFDASSLSFHTGLALSRPSSNGRSQQMPLSQKATVVAKEWKPKATSTPIPQSMTLEIPTSPVHPDTVEDVSNCYHTSANESEDGICSLQAGMEVLDLPSRQCVIIPSHMRVPESERIKLSFGSFDTTSGAYSSNVSDNVSVSTLSETSQGIGDDFEQPSSPYDDEIGAENTKPVSHMHAPKSLGDEINISSSSTQHFSVPVQETASSEDQQGAGASPIYGYGFTQSILDSQTHYESSDPLARDSFCLTNITSKEVQQSFDTSKYCSQIYCPIDNGDHVSPFSSVAAKHTGNAVSVTSRPSQSIKEGGLSLASTSGSTMLTHAGGFLQSSIPITQPSLPVFRPPGLPMPPLHPNYIPYGPYYSSFYVPPPGLHQYLGNGVIPQQPHAANLYTARPVAGTMGVKISVPHLKAGAGTGSLPITGMPSGFMAPHGSPSASSALSVGTQGVNDDLSLHQFKDSMYIPGQQTNGSAVWFAAPGREVSNLPPTPFYSLPQNQHMTLPPTQPGHGTIAAIFHPAQHVNPAPIQPQTVGVSTDIPGITTSMYQQQPHHQANWPANY